MVIRTSAGWQRLGVVAWVTLTAALVSSLGAQGWPSLRQGSWSISRTIDAQGGGSPKVVTTTRCMTPSEDWDRQNAQLTKAGCSFSPVTKDATGYWFSSTCKMMGVESSSRTTIVPEGDSAFTLTVVGTTDGKPMREVMKARRVGDCAK